MIKGTEGGLFLFAFDLKAIKDCSLVLVVLVICKEKLMSAFEEDLPELASKVTGGEKVSATEESAPAAPVEEEDTTLANSDVCAKYQDAAKVTQFVAGEVAAKCVAGAKVHDICLFGDELITAQCEPMYRNRVAVAGAKEDTAGRIIEKGVAFPCCISVNSVVCHMSPLTSEADVRLIFPPLSLATSCNFLTN